MKEKSEKRDLMEPNWGDEWETDEPSPWLFLAIVVVFFSAVAFVGWLVYLSTNC